MRTFGLMMLLCSCVTMAGGPATTPYGPPVKTHLAGEITAVSVGPLVAALSALPDMTTKPAAIFVEINSEGGEVEAGFALAKAIEASPVPVICIVDGQAASMAFYILQSCDVRAMTPRSSLMMHQVTLVGAMKASTIKALQKQIDTYNKAMVGQCAAKMKLPATEIADKIAAGDWWMAADEALEVGAVDSIIPVSSLP